MTPKSKKLTAAAALATLIAIPAEGLRQYAYYDPPGILTVCYGSTTNVVKGRKYSLEECKDRLDADMMEAITTVDACVPNAPVPVLAAFADAVYNIGPRIACNTRESTAARLMAARQWDAACKQLPRWNKARVAGAMVALPGLTKRRKAEETLCLSWSQPD